MIVMVDKTFRDDLGWRNDGVCRVERFERAA